MILSRLVVYLSADISRLTPMFMILSLFYL